MKYEIMKKSGTGNLRRSFRARAAATTTADVCGRPAPAGQQGSVIVLALLILAILTVGGITAINRSWVESRIVANTAIHKQNLALAEAAAMEGAGRLLNPPLPPSGDAIDHFDEDWFHDRHDLDPNDLLAVDDTNSVIPAAVLDQADGLDILDQRGEVDRDAGGDLVDATLRYYAIGWFPVSGFAGGESIVDSPGQAVARDCRVIGVYQSDRFGRKAIEIGVRMYIEAI